MVLTTDNTAATAFAAFEAGLYRETLALLELIRDREPTDPKVLHNLAVVNAYLEDQTNPRELIEKLSSIKTLVEQQAEAGGSPPTAPTPTAPTPTPTPSSTRSTSQHSSQPTHSSSTTSDALKELNAAGTPPLDLNVAALHMQQGQYGAALRLLEPMLQQVESLDDEEALRAGLLLLDCHMEMRDLSKAAEVLGLMNHIFDSVPSSGRGRAATSSTPSTSKGGSSSSTAEVGGKPQVGLPQRRLIAPASEVQSALQVAHARLFLLRREKRAAEQAIIQVLRTSPADSAAIGLSMELNYSTGQLFLAGQQLGQQLARNSTRCRALDLGNLGLLHHCLGKHSTALLYLTQALSQAKRESAARTAPSAKPSVAQVASLQYSAGLQLLLTRQFESAADMFQQAALVQYQSPLLWLRMAECCIGAHCGGAPFQTATVEKGTAKVGGSRLPCYLLPEALTSSRSEGDDPPSAVLSIPAALRYLRNARFLLAQTEAGHRSTNATDAERLAQPSGKGAGNKSNDSTASALPPAIDHAAASPTPRGVPLSTRLLKERERQELRLAILTNMAYVHLLNDNPVQAISEAKTVLMAEGSRPANRYVAHCYSAEALCVLGRADEAAEHVRLAMEEHQTEEAVEGEAAEAGSSPLSPLPPVPPRSDDIDAASFASTKHTKALLHVNVASVHAMRGKLDKAMECALAALEHLPEFQPAQLMLVYLHLRSGAAAEALDILRAMPVTTI